jgi:hypothetical protein
MNCLLEDSVVLGSHKATRSNSEDGDTLIFNYSFTIRQKHATAECWTAKQNSKISLPLKSQFLIINIYYSPAIHRHLPND